MTEEASLKDTAAVVEKSDKQEKAESRNSTAIMASLPAAMASSQGGGGSGGVKSSSGGGGSAGSGTGCDIDDFDLIIMNFGKNMMG
jgi:membrane protein involved in colicin uptake